MKDTDIGGWQLMKFPDKLREALKVAAIQQYTTIPVLVRDIIEPYLDAAESGDWGGSPEDMKVKLTGMPQLRDVPKHQWPAEKMSPWQIFKFHKKTRLRFKAQAVKIGCTMPELLEHLIFNYFTAKGIALK